MERADVLAALRAHEQELRVAGVLSVSLFGSVARGEASANDVDVAVRCGESFSARGLNYFNRLSEIEERLTGILGCKVDVVEEPVRKKRFQSEIDGTEPLPSDKPARRLEDIVENAEAIRRYTADMDVAAFSEDRKAYDAVERCLERISEAAAKLGDLAPVLVPGQPWQEIRALGNRLRHKYDDIREDRLWDIVHINLPPLRIACEDALRRRREGQGNQ